jgi:outer membrane protein OmpA-like peptidoglycan-associated protein
MSGIGIRPALIVVLAAASWPAMAAAQAAPDELMGLDKGSLKSEIGKRYDEALALTLDKAIEAADNPRFLWASQAKAQCGIALGFLKSGTKDPVSIGKCDDAYRRMQLQAAPPPPPPPPPVACNKTPYIVFFDWNRSDVTAEAASTLDATVATLRDCGNPSVTLDGYTDTSGTDAYNRGLSEQRAAGVRAYLVSHGVPDASISTQGYGETNLRVPTADGVRELQNRRVEITVK